MPLTLSNRKNVRPARNASIVRQVVLAEDAQPGDWVAVDDNDNAVLARANALSTVRAVGCIVAGEGVLPNTTFVLGQTVSAVMHGVLFGYTGMDPNADVFVSAATAGSITQTEPTGAGTWSFRPGYVLASDMLFVSPQLNLPAENA